MRKENDLFAISYIFEKRGKITFYFERTNFDLKGWNLLNIDSSLIVFEIYDDIKNLDFKESFFDLPKEIN